jgi:hydrogenase maturation factor
MNLLFGDVIDIFEEQGLKIGHVRILGVRKKVPLDLLTNVRGGDRVLICDGVAIAKVSSAIHAEENNVSRDSR